MGGATRSSTSGRRRRRCRRWPASMLADQGELDLYAPVYKFWPEFRANNKAGVEVRHVMSHTAGLPSWSAPITVETLYDWDQATSLLAAQEPWWEPGTASGYHAITQGYLEGETRPAGHRPDDRRVRGRRDHRPARRRLPHRHGRRARRPGRPRHPAEPPFSVDDAEAGSIVGAGRPIAAARRRGGEHDPVAAGRAPGRRRVRQRPLGRHDPCPDGVRRRGQRRATAVAVGRRSRCSTSRPTPRTSSCR